MSLVRFGVSIEEDVLAKFDNLIKKKGYANRSKAIGDLIRESLVEQEWKSGKVVAGIITLVYDHHQRELASALTNTQHDFHQIIISTQHIHLDHHRCLEVVVVRGKPQEIQGLADKLRSTRGVEHTSLSMATTGKHI